MTNESPVHYKASALIVINHMFYFLRMSLLHSTLIPMRSPSTWPWSWQTVRSWSFLSGSLRRSKKSFNKCKVHIWGAWGLTNKWLKKKSYHRKKVTHPDISAEVILMSLHRAWILALLSLYSADNTVISSNFWPCSLGTGSNCVHI